MNKSNFFEDLNTFVIGLFVGSMVTLAFASNFYKGKIATQEKVINAYGDYYNNVENFLDSLDEKRDLCLDDTDLNSSYGEDYLSAKDKVDSITWRAGYEK